MSETKSSAGTEFTRFNALRHGILSQHTVLPWEDPDEYRALLEAFVAEHAPQGPTQEHLVEELAGILWRKRRLRLAELAAHRRGLRDALSGKTADAALVLVNVEGQSEWVADAIRATAADTEEAIRQIQEHEAMTRRAIELLGSKSSDAYQAAWRHYARTCGLGGSRNWPAVRTNWGRVKSPLPPTWKACVASSKVRCSGGPITGITNWPLAR
jgi:hypothetical protein